MWWLYFICTIIAFGVGIGCGVGFEKLGQYLYFKRISSDFETIVKNQTKDTQRLIENNSDIDTIFLGDSITQGYNLAKFYPNKNYINRGISGDITVGVLDRLQDTVLCLKPRRIVLLIGTNDIGMRYSEEQIVKNFLNIAKLIKTSLPNVELIVEGVYNINESILIDHNRTNAKINSLNSQYQEICKQLGAKYLDANSVLTLDNGMLEPYLTHDGLHLNNRGYEKLTKFLKESIENL